MNTKSSRRGFLRGTLATGAAVTITLPWLASSPWAGRARADADPAPKRFLVWFWGNGQLADQWVPSRTGTDWTRPAMLAPLFTPALSPYLSLLTNARASASSRPHGGGASAILTGTALVHEDGDNGTPGGPSIDQIIANRIEVAPSGIRSIELGVAGHFSGASGTAYNYISHRGPDQFNEYQRDPRMVFQSLFGGVSASDPYETFRGSVLDAVRQDASALSSGLTSADRARLDQHLTAIRELETRVAAAPNTCTVADPGARVTNEMIQSVRTGEQNLTLLNDVMSELLAMAFACDLTRVASYMYSGPAAFTRYHELAGLSRDEYGQPEAIHSMTHGGRLSMPEFTECQAEAMRHFARTLEAFSRVPEGSGSLLDNLVILGTSCTGNAPDHVHDDFPLIVAGGGGGALLTGGVHHRFSSPENTSRIPLTLAHAMDVPLASFGVGDGLATEPVMELLS